MSAQTFLLMLRSIFWILLILTVGIGLFFFVATIKEFRPQKVTLLYKSNSKTCLSDSAIFSVLTWNIGYGGLGSNMDFFYDGGTHMRDTKENTIKNLDEIRNFINSCDTLDFIMIQEIDSSSKRTYHIDEMTFIDSALTQYTGFMALNYKADFIPVPLKSPMGKVNSGIACFTKHQAQSIRRYSYPGSFSWPKSLFMPKRCFLECRYNLTNGKEFILINTHNTAFDDGSLRSAEVTYLQDFALQEYNKGNYVLIGGDWNQTPAGFTPKFKQPFDTDNAIYLPREFLNDWNIAYLDNIPTNRQVKKPYQEGITPTTVIDFFIVSPNIQVLSEQVIDLKFENSDHQPVMLTFKFHN